MYGMEDVTLAPITGTKEFQKKKADAWKYIKGKGDFNIDDFEPAEYKYFDLLLQIYGKFKDEKITAESAKAEDERISKEFENYVDQRLSYIHDRIMINENIKIAHDEITAIEKSRDKDEMLSLAMDAIGKFIGDESFRQRQERKLKR